MRKSCSIACVTAVALSMAVPNRVQAAESGFSIYALGSLAFGAGSPPPPGWYFTTAVGYYKALFRTNNLIGGVATVGLDLKFLQTQFNVLYVPTEKILGGTFGLSATLPTGCVELGAQVVVGPISRSREVSGCGLGDMSAKAQLGWTIGDFSHTLYLTGYAPTGRYDTGFQPNIGLNRPAFDVTWGATWLERASGIEFSGAVGMTFNAENTATQYKSGDDFHMEWAVGKKFGPQWTLGVAGYHYWQVTGDSGAGATLGAFKGQTNAVGPAVSYVTELAGHVMIFNGRMYFEYDSLRRFEGTSTLGSVTVRF